MDFGCQKNWVLKKVAFEISDRPRGIITNNMASAAHTDLVVKYAAGSILQACYSSHLSHLRM
jgi:hypothetical protein